MSKKLILLAIMPILFQSDVYCSNQFTNVNKMIMPKLQAVYTMNNSDRFLNCYLF